MIPEIRPIAHPVSQREYPSAFCGAIVPLFTPERLDGRIDFDGLEALADYYCRKSSVSSLLIRTGESAMWSYSLEEARDAIRVVLEVARGRKPVITGTAGIWDGTAENKPRPAVYFRRAVDLSQWALLQGAAAVLQPVALFLERGYDYTAQEVVLRFYQDVAQAINGPIVIYNQDGLPPGYALTPGSLARLSQMQQFLGVIYYTKDASLLGEIVRMVNPRFGVASGCDSVAVPAFMSGATSSAGGLAALVPEVIGAAWESLQEPDLPSAWRAQTDLLRVREVLSPWAMADIGCAVLARQGVAMAARSRATQRPPEVKDVERVTRELNYVCAAYM